MPATKPMAPSTVIHASEAQAQPARVPGIPQPALILASRKNSCSSHSTRRHQAACSRPHQVAAEVPGPRPWRSSPTRVSLAPCPRLSGRLLLRKPPPRARDPGTPSGAKIAEGSAPNRPSALDARAPTGACGKRERGADARPGGEGCGAGAGVAGGAAAGGAAPAPPPRRPGTTPGGRPGPPTPRRDPPAVKARPCGPPAPERPRARPAQPRRVPLPGRASSLRGALPGAPTPKSRAAPAQGAPRAPRRDQPSSGGGPGRALAGAPVPRPEW